MSNSALCISGQPRHLVRGAKLIHENIIKPNETNSSCHVFIHMWCPENEQASLRSQLVDLYDPVYIQLEPQVNFSTPYLAGPYDDGLGEKRVFNIQSMWYSIYRAHALAKLAQIERQREALACSWYVPSYRWFARVRSDWDVQEPVIFNKGDPNRLNVYNDCIHTETCITDHFAFGSERVMDTYSNTYNKFEYITEQYRAYCCSEILLGYNMLDQGIEVAQIPFKTRPIPLH